MEKENESICTMEDILSPISENPPALSPLSSANDKLSCLHTLHNKSEENLESVTLETSPTLESLNLVGSTENIPDDIISHTSIIDEATHTQNDSEKNSSKSTKDSLDDVNDVQDHNTLNIADKFDDKFVASSIPGKSLSSYFTKEDNVNSSEADIFNQIAESSIKQTHSVDNITSLNSKVLPTTVLEGIAVDFEEEKGTGLKFNGSMQNVSQFFSDDNASDSNNFFTSFTSQGPEKSKTNAANENDKMALKNSTQTLMTIPSIDESMSLLDSPAHLKTSRSRTTSGMSAPSPTRMLSISNDLTDSLNVFDLTVKSDDDIFTSSLNMSDADRRKDAWIPCEATQQLITSILTTGNVKLEEDQVTQPKVILNEPLGDPVKDLVQKFMGDHEAFNRKTLGTNDVSPDEDGLHKLMTAECYRSAVDLTTRILTIAGQGAYSQNSPSKITPDLMRIWSIRLLLLVKLKKYTDAENELVAFRNLDQADLYYELYQDILPGRRGSIVPFSFRILSAEIPQYLGKSQDTLDRLHYVQAIIRKILDNLNNGMSEDGSVLHLSQESLSASLKLWSKRYVQTLYSIGNCLVNIKDYRTAITIFKEILEKDADHQIELLSGIGRLHLQMGDIKTGQSYFDEVSKITDTNSTDTAKSHNQMNKAFIALGANQFNEAYQYFSQARNSDPCNAVAVNNMAVCLLYMGRLQESLEILESLVQKNPHEMLQEGILFNLCTLYELESSRAMQKKQSLLELVSKHKGNGFNVACLKMT